MGTSASNPGPKGRRSLLPPWAPPAPEDDAGSGDDAPDNGGADEATADGPPGDGAGDGSPADGNADGPGDHIAVDVGDPTLLGSWTSPRRIIGRLAASSSTGAGARDDVRRAVGGAVRAMGGGRGASRIAPSGRATARALGGFLSAVRSQGVAEAARQFGLAEYLGQGVRVFLARLVDTLAPASAMTEDVVARVALAGTLEDLEDRLDLASDGLDALDRLTPELVADVLVGFLARYAYERVLAALAHQLATRAADAARTRAVEREAWRYIEDAVQADLPDRLRALKTPAGVLATRWDGAEGRAFVDRLFTECFEVLGVAA